MYSTKKTWLPISTPYVLNFLFMFPFYALYVCVDNDVRFQVLKYYLLAESTSPLSTHSGAVLLYYFGAPVNKTGTNQKEKGGREPAACPKKRVPIVEKREDDAVSTMHGAVANTFFQFSLEL